MRQLQFNFLGGADRVAPAFSKPSQHVIELHKGEISPPHNMCRRVQPQPQWRASSHLKTKAFLVGISHACRSRGAAALDFVAPWPVFRSFQLSEGKLCHVGRPRKNLCQFPRAGQVDLCIYGRLIRGWLLFVLTHGPAPFLVDTVLIHAKLDKQRDTAFVYGFGLTGNAAETKRTCTSSGVRARGVHDARHGRFVFGAQVIPSDHLRFNS
jgi:hypothetical protein